MIVYGVDRRALFSISPQFWDSRFPHRLSDALGHPDSSGTFRDTTKADVQKEFPGALSFAMKHNWLVGSGGALAGIALLVVFQATCGNRAS